MKFFKSFDIVYWCFLPPSIPNEWNESSSRDRRIFLARPTLSKLTLSFKHHCVTGGTKRRKQRGGLPPPFLSVAWELQVIRRYLSRLPRAFSNSLSRAFSLLLVFLFFSFFPPSLSFFLFYLFHTTLKLHYSINFYGICPFGLFTFSSDGTDDTRLRATWMWHRSSSFVDNDHDAYVSEFARWYLGFIVDYLSFLWNLSG